ncbi:DUF2789 domain-containing protein [Vogesella oryzae]|uniref:DUF2789 domain-containing protein n=1 Tax=Vogesella oryzae TaxID=1735285 RepID=UPI00158384C3|nr:DUF2789 domain-containing protein [Vogesella oryzae]
MDTSSHDLQGLFKQLGLPADAHAIRAFIASHPLAHETNIEEAPFWSPSQAAFLKQSLDEDAEWAEAVDALANLLSG